VYAGPAGLRAADFWGRFREVPWTEVVAVRPINMLGLKYLRAYRAGGGSPLWLPLFLGDLGGFGLVVRRYAGPQHPLAVALLDEVF
jgi:hypothetical protein